MKTYNIDLENEKQRLDAFVLMQVYPDRSRNFCQNEIKKGAIKVNDEIVKTGYKLKQGDLVSVKDYEVETLDLEPVNLDLDIIYEDEDLAIINKPQGLVVHPASSYKETTLVHGLLHQMSDLSDINGVIRPGIVHRIDKDTSGLLIVAKHDKAHQLLSEMLKKHDIKRTYLAIVYNPFKETKASIDAPIGRSANNRIKMAVVKDGKHAITHFEVLGQNLSYALVKCELETGRTHQIRVHMAYINHPIVGDPVYGPKKAYGKTGQYLHAYKLAFMHPIKKEYMTFNVDIPSEFKTFLNQFKIDFVL
jgi:23S rRNA pseudouridine1911/1915/1917 synthase